MIGENKRKNNLGDRIARRKQNGLGWNAVSRCWTDDYREERNVFFGELKIVTGASHGPP